MIRYPRNPHGRQHEENTVSLEKAFRVRRFGMKTLKRKEDAS